MSKKLLLLSSFFLIGSLGLEANEYQSKENKQQEMVELKSAVPPEPQGCSLFLDIGLIAQQMRVSGSEIATFNYQELRDFGAGPVTVQMNKILTTDFNFDVGVHAGIGYGFGKNDWMTKANFEWISSKKSLNHAVTNEDNEIIPFGTRIQNYQIVQTEDVPDFNVLTSSFKIDYYLLDILFTKGVYFSKYVSFEPFGGLKAAWISYRNNQSYLVDEDETVPAGTLWLNDSKVDFWGVGPVVGMSGNYGLTWGFSLYTSMNIAILLGETTVNNLVRYSPPAGANPNDPDNAFQTMGVVSPTFRATLGLQYDSNGFSDTQHVCVHVGFDGRYYGKQYPVITYTPSEDEDAWPTIKSNAFGMVGLVADLGWYF